MARTVPAGLISVSGMVRDWGLSYLAAENIVATLEPARIQGGNTAFYRIADVQPAAKEWLWNRTIATRIDHESANEKYQAFLGRFE